MKIEKNIKKMGQALFPSLLRNRKKIKKCLSLFFLIFLLICIVLIVGSKNARAVDESKMLIPTSDQNPLRDVAWDEKGNIYVIAMRWDVDRPQIKSYSPDGKLRTDFNLVIYGFCCEPFPLKIVYGYDGFLYVLLPSKEGLLHGGDIQLIRINTNGIHDQSFGVDGVLPFPSSFKLRDFDVSSDGKIWILNDKLELFTFDESGQCVLVRKLKDVFPEEIKGGRLQHYFGRNLFAMNDERLLLIGLMDISSMKYGDRQYYSALELDYEGRLQDHKEWEVPWFPEGSKPTSFHSPLQGKSFIRNNGQFGSVLGFPQASQDEPNKRALVIADWSIDDGFHFYNIIPLSLPKEIYLDYDLNDAFFLRNSDKTIAFFPMGRTKKLVVQVYDKDGKTTDTWFWDVFM